jgi:hypothetical protein
LRTSEATLAAPIRMQVRIGAGFSARSILLCLALMAIGAVAAAAEEPQFSADIVFRDRSGTETQARARLYAANGKIRIETAEAADGYFLIDSEASGAIFVRPSLRSVMDAKQSSRLTRIFVIAGADDACRRWQSAEVNAGVPAGAVPPWRCEQLESRPTPDVGMIEYRVQSAGQLASERWVARDLNVPVKIQSTDGATISLERIRLEAQPPGLFIVPPDYRKVDPRAVIERIKHSDVWAEHTPPPP